MVAPEIRAVFFDAVGTLIVPDPSVAEVYAQAGRRHGLDLRTDVIAQRFREAFQAEEAIDRGRYWRTSEAREQQRWQTIVARVFDEAPVAELIFDELYAHFGRPSAWRVMPGTGDLLQALAARGLNLGFASNFDHRLHAVAAGWPDLAPLRQRIVSSDVGWLKPSPRFFDAVIRAAGSEGREILFVGDSLLHDYEPALAAGLQAVLFDPNMIGAKDLRSIRGLIELIQ